MKDIAQEIYENLQANIDKYNYLHLLEVATLNMIRTNKVICLIAKTGEFKEIECLNEYIIKYLHDFTSIKKKIIDENVEVFLESSAEKIEDINLSKDLVLYLTYELCETWYNFVNLLHYGCTEDDKEDLIAYITLPIRLLDNYISDEIYLLEKDEIILNEKVRSDKRIEVEKKFIFSELENVIDKAHYEMQFKICVNYNILEKI